jgi:hypothetical protein
MFLRYSIFVSFDRARFCAATAKEGPAVGFGSRLAKEFFATDPKVFPGEHQIADERGFQPGISSAQAPFLRRPSAPGGPNGAQCMITKLTLRLACAAFLTLPLAAIPQVALALPVHKICRITTYYHEADLINVVGTRTTCPVKMTGHTSKYFEVEVIDVGTPSGPGGPGPGGTPCEFVPDGTGPWDPQNTCQNLPLDRGSVFN